MQVFSVGIFLQSSDTFLNFLYKFFTSAEGKMTSLVYIFHSFCVEYSDLFLMHYSISSLRLFFKKFSL